MSEIISERIPLEVEGTPVCDIMIKKPYTCRAWGKQLAGG